MELEITIKIKNVQSWSTDWNNQDATNEELDEFESDFKNAISENCGIEYDDIEVENISVKKML
jgi:hypothetical protein